MAGILETRIKEANTKKGIERMARGWQNICNYPYALIGRIWLLWQASEVDVHVLKVHAQFIHYKVTCRNTD